MTTAEVPTAHNRKGNTLMPTLLSSQSTLRQTWVKKSRSEFTCVLGCTIPPSSAYFRLDVMAGGGCGSSTLELAICPTHLTQLDIGGEDDPLDAEQILSDLDL